MEMTFLFPGQGSQKTGMGADLDREFASARARFECANDILGRDIASICFNGPDEALKATRNTQPALFIVEAALCDVLIEKGFVPVYCAGHSLGEYSALYAAGAFTFEDGLRIVARRGELMAKAGERRPGTMAAIIGLPLEKILQVLSEVKTGVVVPANQNSPDQTVISGEIDAVRAACVSLKNAGAKRALELPVSGAFHSPLMQEVADEFGDFLAAFHFQKPRCPVITNVTAQAQTDPATLKELLVKQLVSPVRWVESIAALAGLPYGRCVEVGPGSVLAGLVRKCDRSIDVVSCATVENIFSLIF